MKRLFLLLVLLATLLSQVRPAQAQNNATSWSNSASVAYATSGQSGFGQELSITPSDWPRIPVSVLGGAGNSYTVQFFARAQTANAAGNQYHILFGHDGTGQFWLQDVGPGLSARVTVAGTVTSFTAPNNLDDGAYHHIALMIGPGSSSTGPSPTTSIWLLIDGALAGSALNVTGAYTGAAAPNGNDDVGTFSGNPGSAWTGNIDDLAISTGLFYPTSGTYTVPTAPIANNAPGLLALYHFDGNLNDSTVGAVMTAGVPSQVSSGDGAATLDAGLPTGGSGSYTYQWYHRGADDDGNTTVVATTRTYSPPGLINGVPQRFAVRVSDGNTSVTTDWVFAVAQKVIVLVNVGDSLTQGAAQDALAAGGYEPPAPTVEGNYLQAALGGAYKVIVTNYAQGGTQTGQWRTDSTTAYTRTAAVLDTTTAGGPNTLLNNALSGINAAISTYGAGNVVVAVCLGTNDPNDGNPSGDAATSAANLTNTLTAIKATGAKVVLHNIPWRAGYGNTYNGYRNATFDGIVAALGGPAAGVFRGDKGGVVAYQAGHTEFYQGGAGPHDTQAYLNVRGAIWGAAVARSVFGVGAVQGPISLSATDEALLASVAGVQRAGQPVTLPALPPVALAANQAFNNTGQVAAPGWLGVNSVLLPADHTAIQADVAGVPAATVAAMKADSVLARTFLRSKGAYTYNPTTGVMSLLKDDGTPLLGSDGVTPVTLTISSQTATGIVTGKQ